jgi:hypothetical protein
MSIRPAAGAPVFFGNVGGGRCRRGPKLLTQTANLLPRNDYVSA